MTKKEKGETTMTMEQILAEEKAAREEYERNTKVGQYTIAQLRQAFDAMTEGQTNWKEAFTVVVKGESVLICVAAIQFFTGDNPKVALDVNRMNYIISTVGYYGACGA
jgi:hypothetical protein